MGLCSGGGRSSRSALLLRVLVAAACVAGAAVSFTRGGSLLLSATRARRLARATPQCPGTSVATARVGGGTAAPQPASPALPAHFACVNGSRDAYFKPPVVRIHALQAPPPWDLEQGVLVDKRRMEHIFPETAGAYPVWAVADAFLQCSRGPPAVVATGRGYRRTELNHSEVEVWAQDARSGSRERLACGAWTESGAYESSAFCGYTGALVAAACARGGDGDPGLAVTVSYRGASSTFVLQRNPEPPRTPVAMVGCFAIDRYLLRLWLEYYTAIGVGTFYLYPNHVREAEATEQLLDVQRIATGIAAHIVIVDWRMLHWILTDNSDNTHGQPMAINNALQRWRHLHSWMLFYDLDEFLVLPRHDGLVHFFTDHAARTGEILALRSPCAWARFDLNETRPGEPTIVDMRLEDFVARRVYRHRSPGSREKYALNTTGADVHGVQFVNLHGIYTHQSNPCDRTRCAETLNAGVGEYSTGPYHLHILNRADTMRNRDSREVFLPPEQQMEDLEVSSFVRRAVVAHKAARAAARAVT